MSFFKRIMSISESLMYHLDIFIPEALILQILQGKKKMNGRCQMKQVKFFQLNCNDFSLAMYAPRENVAWILYDSEHFLVTASFTYLQHNTSVVILLFDQTVLKITIPQIIQ